MPKLEPKQIQKELDAGKLWPVYWLYGQERMKSRELLKRIRKAAVGDGPVGFGEETLDGTEVSAAEILDSARALSLGGGLRFVIIRDAHAIKEADRLAELLGPSQSKSELPSVCVFLSKDLDGRKKFSKMLVEKAAVVPCEEVPEQEREAWIGYLSKRRGNLLEPAQLLALRTLDPWNLEIVDQELEKASLAVNAADAADVLLGGAAEGGAEVFLDAFFRRERRALSISESFADHPDEALPLLGLLAWNARQLSLVVSDNENHTRYAKLSPFLMERLGRWARFWSLSDAVELQSALAELDFGIKQTPRLPLGLWTDLISRFCGKQ